MYSLLFSKVAWAEEKYGALLGGRLWNVGSIMEVCCCVCSTLVDNSMDICMFVLCL